MTKASNLNPIAHDTLVPIKQVCAELGITRTTRWRWQNAGRLPPVIQIGGKAGYSRKKLERWKSANGFIVPDQLSA